MTYTGRMNGGVVVLDGEGPPDGTVVIVTSSIDSESSKASTPLSRAVGIWKDRDDLPADSSEASKVLRARMMRRVDE